MYPNPYYSRGSAGDISAGIEGRGDGEGGGENSKLARVLAKLNALDETRGLAHFMEMAGVWVQKVLKCQSACVMLVSVGGPNGPLVRASEAGDGEGQLHRLVSRCE